MDTTGVCKYDYESKFDAYGEELEGLMSRVLTDILSFIHEFVEKVYEDVEERPPYNINFIVFPDEDKDERGLYMKSSMVTMMSNEVRPKIVRYCRIKRIYVEKFNDEPELLLKGTTIYDEDKGLGRFRKSGFEITVEDLFMILGFFDDIMAREDGYIFSDNRISYSELLYYNRRLRVKEA